jgi:hypothetical protein
MKKHWLFLLMLVTMFLISGIASGGEVSKVPKVPKELQELPLYQVLDPDPDSEEVLDEVVVINAPKGKGQTVRFSVTVAPDEKSGGFELKVDPVRGTYKATKEQPEEVEENGQRMEMYQQLNQNRGGDKDITSSYSTTAVTTWTRAAAILTEDAVNWALCQTSQRLYWNANHTGTSYRYFWGASPTPIGTDWFLGGYNNYRLTVGTTYITSRFWAWYYNWNWLWPSWETTVTHDLYIYGYYNGNVQITGYANYSGESWWLLHSHVRWWL